MSVITYKNLSIKDGEAYCLGSTDADCWYLYTLSEGNALISDEEPDQTLEILMTQLDAEVMSIFTRIECSSASVATQKSGICKLIPHMSFDDFLFEPCGYSMNGITQSVSVVIFNYYCTGTVITKYQVL